MADHTVTGDVPVGRLYAANEAAADFYAGMLPTSGTARQYLRRHGIDSLARSGTWRLGYAPPLWTTLADHLRAAGFGPEEIVAAGLGFTHRATGHLLDRFRDRLVFPITGPDGRVIAFTARDLSTQADATWINTPHTAAYHKGQVLYGLGQQLADPPPGTGPPVVLVVEGAADVLAVHLMATADPPGPGTPPVYAVAPCGTRLTRDQLAILHRALPDAHLMIAFDGDAAGREAVHRAYPTAVTWPGRVSGACLPDGRDPAEILAGTTPADALAAILGSTLPLPQIELVNTIRRLFTAGRITNPAMFAEDRILAYRVIADLFLDLPRLAAPDASRAMALAAAERLGLPVTDVTRGVIEAWDAPLARPEPVVPPMPAVPPLPTTPAAPGAHPQPAEQAIPHARPQPAVRSTRPQPAARPEHAKPDVPGAPGEHAIPKARPAPVTVPRPLTGPEPTEPARPADRRPAVIAATGQVAGRRPADITVLEHRRDPARGVTVWVVAEGTGRYPEAATAAAVAAETAAAVALRSAPAAGLRAARAAVNALYSGARPGQAGDASVMVVAARPDTTAPNGVRLDLAWAGDCRAYTMHAGRLTPLVSEATLADTDSAGQERAEATRHPAARDAAQHSPGPASGAPGGGPARHPTASGPGRPGTDQPRRGSAGRRGTAISAVSGLLPSGSVRAGDIGVRSLRGGPLLVCTGIVHRVVGHTRLAAELTGMTDPGTTADRLITALRDRGTGAAAVLVVDAGHGSAPPAVAPLPGRRDRAPGTGARSAPDAFRYTALAG